MREETLRWGLLLGLIAAIFCVVAVSLGTLVAPLHLEMSAEAVAFAYFSRGMLTFLALGVALGLSYYGGLRSERDLKRAQAADAVEGQPNTPESLPWGERWNAPLTGGIVMLFFWIAATACSYLFPLSQPGVPQQSNHALANAELHLILLVVYLLFGLGAGGIGGRSYTSRLMLDRIIVAPPPLPRRTASQLEAETASGAEVTDGTLATESQAAEPYMVEQSTTPAPSPAHND